ncbi:hypothetical protein Q0F98_19755 [Paenibacillus amylolyticus]|nr:hypothetical protein Q0F98_19755 [Paenibacillus amylolyticus]
MDGRGNRYLICKVWKKFPWWVRSNYEQREKKKWSYHGAGMLLIHMDGQVMVLRKVRM